MPLFSIIVALVIEQVRPLPVQRWVLTPLDRFFGFLDRQFNDGVSRHGVIAWVFGVALPVAALFLVDVSLADHFPIADLVLAIVMLYLTMGFRQVSHHFTDIQKALRAGEVDRARMLLAEWRGFSGDRLSSSEIARLSIERALVDGERHVFAPLILFALLGPGGALLYRLAFYAREYWRDRTHTAHFGDFAQKAFYVIDWLPLRLTAVGFAVTGDFEDAIFCWRTQATSWPSVEEGILLASGAGALGVRLGLPISDALSVEDRPEMGLGDDADMDFMQSTVGLVWRTLVLCLLVLALVWVAGWMH